jgi:hypothetical protein
MDPIIQGNGVPIAAKSAPPAVATIKPPAMARTLAAGINGIGEGKA